MSDSITSGNKNFKSMKEKNKKILTQIRKQKEITRGGAIDKD